METAQQSDFNCVTNSESGPNQITNAASSLKGIGIIMLDYGSSLAFTGQRQKKKTGPKPRPVIEFPDLIETGKWEDPNSFQEALVLHMRRFGDTRWRLFRALASVGGTLDVKTLATWVTGRKSPQSISSLAILGRIEKRYRLPEGYFKHKLPHPGRSAAGHQKLDASGSERRRLAWHLPDDFDTRSASERAEILNWVRTTIISGGTEYRRFQSSAIKNRYAIRFSLPLSFRYIKAARASKLVGANARLNAELASLLNFKTSTLTAVGMQRYGVWGDATASQKIEHFALMFGAMVSLPESVQRGLGLNRNDLTFALFVFPSIWDWYVNWREQRRGFYTAWELDMLRVASALTRTETGWLRQSPHLANHLVPIQGLLSEQEILEAQKDWDHACDQFHKFARIRIKELGRVVRVHRDPFEAILPVLEADSPLGEYRKISHEILWFMPDRKRYPTAAAETVRSYLVLRIGMHSGLRQKNLRQLLVCPRNNMPRTERQLVDLKRGELRWSDKDKAWEVFIPAIAFKNGHSSYFGNRPFRLKLPDLEDLFSVIDSYIDCHRPRLLSGADDPGTFFVKTVKRTSTNAEYSDTAFYELWRLTIQRYGVYNPYTNRGAIKGLLPHGPHNIRDVLATHILKQTGSYEQASYAIQDTPEMVAKHYGRFLPQDKTALAAQILNKVWQQGPGASPPFEGLL